MRLATYVPGLVALRAYKRADLIPDARAGLSVAAIALPIGVAYAELAGFPPQVGFYSSILPLVAYAIFGSSRQLIVGPDAATCAIVASAVAPLAAGNADLYSSLSIMLAFMTGCICIAASFLRLSVLADFLSKPILVGFLNGVAISVIIGQLGKVLGYPVKGAGIVAPLIDAGSNIGRTHLPTLGVAVFTFVSLLLIRRFLSWLPEIVAALALSALLVAAGMDATGVKTIGDIPAGWPPPRLPRFDPDLIPELLSSAAGLALISVASMVPTARSFASRNGYEIDADQDFFALGMANVAAAVSQGFTVSGADSRTAMSEAAGGRTHAVGLVAAFVLTLILMYFTEPLRYIPIGALGAVLVVAGYSLFDFQTLRLIYRVDRIEAALCVIATLGVVAVGPLRAILLVVVLSLIRFVQLTARPRVEILGKIEGMPGFHSIQRHAAGRQYPGILVFRFNGPLVFFNAAYFKRELIEAATGRATSDVQTVILDLLPITAIDMTGMLALRESNEGLRARNVRLCLAGRKTEWLEWAQRRGMGEFQIPFFPTLNSAVRGASS